MYLNSSSLLLVSGWYASKPSIHIFLNFGKSSGIVFSILLVLHQLRLERLLDVCWTFSHLCTLPRVFCIFLSLLHSSNSLVLSAVSNLLFHPFLASVTMHLISLKIQCLFFFPLHNLETSLFHPWLEVTRSQT